MDFSPYFSQRADLMEPPAIREVMQRTASPEFITFTAGKPATALFPYSAIQQRTGEVLDKYGGEALQYMSTMGFKPLREWLAQRMLDGTTADNILMVAGSQQGIDVTCKLLLDAGDKVAVASPTYVTTLSALKVYGAELLAVDSDAEGMLPDSLERALQAGAKLVYCIPNFMNPTGVTTSLARRQAIVALVTQYSALILEDDPYGELRFEGERLPSLYELCPGRVIYTGSFSKILAPGFRLGWLAAHSDLIGNLMLAKQISDLQAGSYVQVLIYEIVQNGFLDQHIARLRDYYHGQRDLIIGAMQKHFPPEVEYVIPAGGMFVWCTLPDHCNADEILELALAQKVAYVPGRTFHPHNSGHNTLRLSYSLVTPPEIAEGIPLLGQILRQAIRQEI